MGLQTIPLAQATPFVTGSSRGLPDNGPYYLYGYSFSLNNSKTVISITMPGNANVKMLALTLVP